MNLLLCKSFSHFFSTKKYCHISDINVSNFNETLTNDDVSFEQLGPDLEFRSRFIESVRKFRKSFSTFITIPDCLRSRLACLNCRVPFAPTFQRCYFYESSLFLSKFYSFLFLTSSVSLSPQSLKGNSRWAGHGRH